MSWPTIRRCAQFEPVPARLAAQTGRRQPVFQSHTELSAFDSHHLRYLRLPDFFTVKRTDVHSPRNPFQLRSRLSGPSTG